MTFIWSFRNWLVGTKAKSHKYIYRDTRISMIILAFLTMLPKLCQIKYSFRYSTSLNGHKCVAAVRLTELALVKPD